MQLSEKECSIKMFCWSEVWECLQQRNKLEIERAPLRYTYMLVSKCNLGFHALVSMHELLSVSTRGIAGTPELGKPREKLTMPSRRDCDDGSRC